MSNQNQTDKAGQIFQPTNNGPVTSGSQVNIVGANGLIPATVVSGIAVPNKKTS